MHPITIQGFKAYDRRDAERRAHRERDPGGEG